MLRLILQRLALGVLTLWAVSMLIFAGTELLPGDLAQAILGQSATPETLEALRQSLGLHDPAVVRYWHWLDGLLHGDLGKSLANGFPIAQILGFRLRNTLLLASTAACIAIPLAVTLGLVAAIKQNGPIDRTINVIALSAVSMPEFFLAYILILVVAVHLAWFPSLSAVFPGMTLGTRLSAIALPVVTLVIVSLAHTMRMTRTSIINVMSHPYIEMAFLKGISRWRIVLQHALPNAIAPIVNVIAISLAYLVVGVVVVEVVFVYPGIGGLMVDAVSKRDAPVVQACGLVFSGTYIVLNLIADVFAILANPRLRTPR